MKVGDVALDRRVAVPLNHSGCDQMRLISQTDKVTDPESAKHFDGNWLYMALAVAYGEVPVQQNRGRSCFALQYTKPPN